MTCACDLTVCIANFNGEQLLPECLDSVLGQECDWEVEIIVHDDASDDRSCAVLREHYPQVRVLKSKRNVGFCVSNNRMAAVANGRYLLFLNNDAALMPGALRALRQKREEFAGDVILTLPQYDWQTGAPVDRGCLLDPFYNPIPITQACNATPAYVIGACLFIPSALWNRWGGFPEWFESLAEDMYLGVRARLESVPVHCVDQSGYRHRQGASFGGNRAEERALNTRIRRRFLSERNKTAVLMIATPGLLVWPWLGIHVLGLIAEGMTLSVLKRDGQLWRQIYLRALVSVWHLRTTIMATRKEVQRHRSVNIRGYLQIFRAQLRKIRLLRSHGLPNVH